MKRTPEQLEASEHDKWCAGLSTETAQAAAHDLLSRAAHNRRDPEHRWIMSRRAALMRLLIARRAVA